MWGAEGLSILVREEEVGVEIVGSLLWRGMEGSRGEAMVDIFLELSH